MFVQENTLPVWLSYAGSKTLVWPQKDFLDAIMNPSATNATHLIEPGKIWMNRFNSLIEPLQDQQIQFNRQFTSSHS
jgi:hypothetical protein